MLNPLSLREKNSWQDSLANLITNPFELLDLLELKPEQIGFNTDVLRDFPLRVPREFIDRMQKANPEDPLFLQVMPQAKEARTLPGYVHDPLGEKESNPVAGILHKYQGRILLMPTSSCAVHCRYCFRRHFPYSDNRPDRKQWLKSLQYVREDRSIKEVILSGGDPLAVSDKHFEWLLEHLANIPHIERVRIHTRLPIVIPQRITQAFCDLLLRFPLKFIIVMHSNHAQELDSEVESACAMLKTAGVELLNQAVLLKKVNDNTMALCNLSERLFKCGILPYYLHMLDKVQGSGHFEVSLSQAHKLMSEVRAQLPGYLVPKLVFEEAGAASKTPII